MHSAAAPEPGLESVSPDRPRVAARDQWAKLVELMESGREKKLFTLPAVGLYESETVVLFSGAERILARVDKVHADGNVTFLLLHWINPRTSKEKGQ